MNLWQKYLKKEAKFCLSFQEKSITLLRYAMALIFLWYGLLKVIDLSPVETIVSHASDLINGHGFFLFLGYWEIAIGLCLFIKKLNRLGLLLLFLQFPGTFLPLFLKPDVYFTIIPFGLTLEGEFIVKNLVFIAAGLVIFAFIHEKSVK